MFYMHAFLQVRLGLHALGGHVAVHEPPSVLKQRTGTQCLNLHLMAFNSALVLLCHARDPRQLSQHRFVAQRRGEKGESQSGVLVAKRRDGCTCRGKRVRQQQERYKGRHIDVT